MLELSEMDEPGKNRLLVVDDEKMNLKILTHILLPEYTVYTAQDGKTAIEIAKDQLPDLILMDIVMPEMDGYEVIAELKQTERVRDIPVIFITGLSSSEDEERGLALGAIDYINKPFIAAIIRLRVKHQIQIINQLRAIERLSMIDQLTNLANRRSFDNRLSIEWARAIREKTPITLLMMDVDKFKSYNDNYGHQQGDMVLQTLGAVFTHTLKRAMDFAARWGGEEFAILLPNVDLHGAQIVAEQIRANVEKAEIPCADGSFTKVTISIGVNTENPTQDSSIDKFISCADEALYAAKEQGRNRVCLYEHK